MWDKIYIGQDFFSKEKQKTHKTTDTILSVFSREQHSKCPQDCLRWHRWCVQQVSGYCVAHEHVSIPSHEDLTIETEKIALITEILFHKYSFTTTICTICIICVKDINSLSMKELLLSQMMQMAQILLYRTA